MRRREFITLLGGAAAAWPIAAHTQQSAMPVIGWLSVGAPIGHLLGVFKQSLAEAGFVEGRNVVIKATTIVCRRWLPTWCDARGRDFCPKKRPAKIGLKSMKDAPRPIQAVGRCVRSCTGINRLRRRVLPDSGHPEITHHSALLMFDDMTVQHPVAGIVGDKGNLDLLLRQEKHGIRVMHRQVLPAAVDDLERVAVNMDRMQEWRCVLQGEQVRATAIEHRKRRRHNCMVAIRPRSPVDGPEDAGA
jgi:hypothetical protein